MYAAEREWTHHDQSEQRADNKLIDRSQYLPGSFRQSGNSDLSRPRTRPLLARAELDFVARTVVSRVGGESGEYGW